MGYCLLCDEPDAFDALRDLAAGRHQVDPGAIEKDYWATEVLRSATAPIDGVEQFALVLEVVIGSRRTDPGLAGDRAQRQGRRAFVFQQPSSRIDQRAAKIAMVIGPVVGGCSFSHDGHSKSESGRRKDHLDGV